MLLQHILSFQYMSHTTSVDKTTSLTSWLYGSPTLRHADYDAIPSPSCVKDLAKPQSPVKIPSQPLDPIPKQTPSTHAIQSQALEQYGFLIYLLSYQPLTLQQSNLKPSNSTDF